MDLLVKQFGIRNTEKSQVMPFIVGGYWLRRSGQPCYFKHGSGARTCSPTASPVNTVPPRRGEACLEWPVLFILRPRRICFWSNSQPGWMQWIREGLSFSMPYIIDQHFPMGQCQGCVGWRAELSVETMLSWIVPVSEAGAVFRGAHRAFKELSWLALALADSYPVAWGFKYWLRPMASD